MFHRTEGIVFSPYAEYDQNTWGSPYFYARLDSILFTYLNLVFLYDVALLYYQSIDVDDNLDWINLERTVLTQSLNIDASLLLPPGGMSFQVGYGYTFDSTRFDSAPPVWSNRHYLILAARKAGA
jgi:hypothetical protein